MVDMDHEPVDLGDLENRTETLAGLDSKLRQDVLTLIADFRSLHAENVELLNETREWQRWSETNTAYQAKYLYSAWSGKIAKRAGKSVKNEYVVRVVEKAAEPDREVQYAAELVAATVRDIMRAMANADCIMKYRAATALGELAHQIWESDTINAKEIIEWAVTRLAVPSEFSNPDHDLIGTAEKGMQYLVEFSSGDTASAGRAAKRKSEFLSDIRRVARRRPVAAR
jgi:hypothetical protein